MLLECCPKHLLLYVLCVALVISQFPGKASDESFETGQGYLGREGGSLPSILFEKCLLEVKRAWVGNMGPQSRPSFQIGPGLTGCGSVSVSPGDSVSGQGC